MVISEKNYDALMISTLIVLFSTLWLVGSVHLVKEMQKNNQLTGFAVSDKTINQSQTQQEIYSIKSYTIFYLSLIGVILVITVISLALIIPRIKKYT